MVESLLESGLAQLGITASVEQLESVRSYLSEIELWNPRAGLVNAAGEDLLVRHLFDSLGALQAIRDLPHRTIADVGSGAGFPGIPLAIFLPDSRVSLIERSKRRCAFLRNVVALTGLRDRVAIVEGDLPGVRDRFDIVTFRAVGSLAEMLPGLAAIARPGGAVVAYKGRQDVVAREVAEATARVGRLSGEGCVKIVPLEVPGLAEERTLVVIRLQ